MRRHVTLASIRHVPTPQLAGCPVGVLARARAELEVGELTFDNVDGVLWTPTAVLERPAITALRIMHPNEGAVMEHEFKRRIHERAARLLEPGAVRPLDDSTEKLVMIAKKVSLLPYSSQIVVFGSMAVLGEKPQDIDLCLDLLDVQFDDDSQLSAYSQLLGIARAHYGSVDPFLRFRNALLVRNDTATGWTRARNSRGIGAAIYAHGRPLAEVIEIYSA